MKVKLLLLFLGLLLVCCNRNTSTSNFDDSTISIQTLKEHTIKLASDEFEGRGAGYKGEKKAAIYIAQQFGSIDLEPINVANGYFMPFSYYARETGVPWQEMNTQNVVGIYRGKSLPEEYIIVGAHHDGQGISGQGDLGRDINGLVSDSLAVVNDSIWNSAVDNAVSISAILEIARVLKANNLDTKRSIIFTTFSAEESGLDGSTYFANNLPVPKNQIKAMINLEQLIGDPDAEFLYVSYDSNPIFEQTQQAIDSFQAVKLKPFYAGIIADTDHYPFYMRQIPSITMGTGSQINIHTPLDHADKIDYRLLQQRTYYILNYIQAIANADTNIDFLGDTSKHLGILGCSTSTSELQDSDVNLAFKVTNVVKNSKGYNAGIRRGDLILNINNQSIEIPEFYREFIEFFNDIEDETVTLTVFRDNAVIELGLQIK